VCTGCALTASDRRFKHALEQPFWSTLEGGVRDRLWQALGRPGAPLPCLYMISRIRVVQRSMESWRSLMDNHNCPD
jgi:hypothetical protein